MLPTNQKKNFCKNQIPQKRQERPIIQISYSTTSINREKHCAPIPNQAKASPHQVLGPNQILES